MHKLIKMACFVITAIGLLGACQTTKSTYSNSYSYGSQLTLPEKRNYASLDEHLIRLALYWIPRACSISTVTKHRNPNIKTSKREDLNGTFTILSISQNGNFEYRHWHAASVRVRSSRGYKQAYGKLFINANNPEQATCELKTLISKYLNSEQFGWKSEYKILSKDQIQKLVRPDALEW